MTEEEEEKETVPLLEFAFKFKYNTPCQSCSKLSLWQSRYQKEADFTLIVASNNYPVI